MELINFAIGGAKSEIYNQPDEAIAPEIKQIVKSVIEDAPVEGLLESLPEMFFEWLKRRQWEQMWKLMGSNRQIKVLSLLLLLLPAKQLGVSG